MDQSSSAMIRFCGRLALEDGHCREHQVIRPMNALGRDDSEEKNGQRCRLRFDFAGSALRLQSNPLTRVSSYFNIIAEFIGPCPHMRSHAEFIWSVYPTARHTRGKRDSFCEAQISAANPRRRYHQLCAAFSPIHSESS